jgi:hypothetical protein
MKQLRLYDIMRLNHSERRTVAEPCAVALFCALMVNALPSEEVL